VSTPEDWLDAFHEIARLRFNAALLEIMREFRTESPYASGQLAEGVAVTSQSDADFTAVVESTARSPRGRDYGTILNRGTGGMIIRPTKAKALHWQDTSGEHFAKFVRGTDIHKGWWDDIVSRWPIIVRDVRI